MCCKSLGYLMGWEINLWLDWGGWLRNMKGEVCKEGARTTQQFVRLTNIDSREISLLFNVQRFNQSLRLSVHVVLRSVTA
jgi:hypothetical protein